MKNGHVETKTSLPLHILPPGVSQARPAKKGVTANFIVIDKAPSDVAMIGYSRDAKYAPFVREVLEKVQKQDDPNQTIGVQPIVSGEKIEDRKELTKIAALLNSNFKKTNCNYRARFSLHYDCFIIIPASMAKRSKAARS